MPFPLSFSSASSALSSSSSAVSAPYLRSTFCSCRNFCFSCSARLSEKRRLEANSWTRASCPGKTSGVRKRCFSDVPNQVLFSAAAYASGVSDSPRSGDSGQSSRTQTSCPEKNGHEKERTHQKGRLSLLEVRLSRGFFVCQVSASAERPAFRAARARSELLDASLLSQN